MKIKPYRILGNALTAFFTVLYSINLSGIDITISLKAATIGAIIQAGLSVGKDLKDAEEGEHKSTALLF